MRERSSPLTLKFCAEELTSGPGITIVAISVAPAGLTTSSWRQRITKITRSTAGGTQYSMLRIPRVPKGATCSKSSTLTSDTCLRCSRLCRRTGSLQRPLCNLLRSCRQRTEMSNARETSPQPSCSPTVTHLFVETLNGHGQTLHVPLAASP